MRACGNGVVYVRDEASVSQSFNVFLTFCLKIRALLQRKRKFRNFLGGRV